MKLLWCTLTVKNMEESLKFYREITGLTIDRRFKAGPGMEIAFLGDGETKLELVCNEGKQDIKIGQDISLGFEVESVDKMIEQLKEKGIVISGGPFQPNPHIRFFYLLDPNGWKIQLVENI